MQSMKWRRMIFTMCLCGVVFTGVHSVRADEGETEEGAVAESVATDWQATIEDGQVMVSKGEIRVVLPLPQAARAVYQRGNLLYVAAGSSGVIVFQLTDSDAVQLRIVPTPSGNAMGFFVSGERVWVETHLTNATVLEDADAQGAAMVNLTDATTPVPAVKSKKNKEVLTGTPPKAHPLLARDTPITVDDTFPGEVKLNVGTSDGVQLKDRFEIYRNVSVKGGGEVFTGKELVAMVEITAVNETSAIGKLPRGDRAIVGDEAAYVDKRISRRNMFPEKLTNIGNAGFTARPILNLAGNSGGGALVDLDVSYYGKHTFAGFRVKPLAIGGTNEGTIFNSMALVEGGYDGRAFAVGLGVGAGITNGRMNATISDDWWGDSATDDNVNSGAAKHAAFALSQFIRLGPMDGLNLTISNAFLFASISQVGSEDEGFAYGSTSAQLNIPLGYRVNMFLGGGGGRLGHAYGEIGVLAWLRGNGDAGSISVSGAVGGAGAWVTGKKLDSDRYAEETFMAGPMVSFGLNYRFGYRQTKK